jgi:hypothetical protein
MDNAWISERAARFLEELTHIELGVTLDTSCFTRFFQLSHLCDDMSHPKAQRRQPLLHHRPDFDSEHESELSQVIRDKPSQGIVS